MHANAVSKPADTQKKGPANIPSSMVLFDEDYRAHIEHLNKLLTRERQAVLALRGQVRELQAHIRNQRAA